MGTATLQECFACSWRMCWLPRPLRFVRPFQPIRCYPETAPPQWQCTYGDGKGYWHITGNLNVIFNICHFIHPQHLAEIQILLFILCFQ